MDRRHFLKTSAIAAAAAGIAPATLSAKAPYSLSEGDEKGSDFAIVSDRTENGVRYVSATPSSIVCSKRIDIEIDVNSGTIRKCEFTRGCPGNSVGLCRLIKGMKVQEVSETLKGTPCGNRGTSCPDQLSRILAKL